MIYIVALGVGLKCLRKIHLNPQGGGGADYAHHIGLSHQMFWHSDAPA